jgi:ADP-dependent NAD(P)H-hydrate dehydratase / NAD(P)H-hydrate epimerase
MPKAPIPSDPVLSPAGAREFEGRLFGSDERKEWKAMQHAGRSLAEAVLRDLAEAGGLPPAASVLVLAGTGNNAGDALIAARELLERHPKATADVLFAFGPRKLKPLATRAWRGLSEASRSRVRSVDAEKLSGGYDLCLDGIFGFQYRPPLPLEAKAAIAASRRCAIRFRAAVDLPTGWDEAGAFEADFTYATGSAKTPLLGSVHAGRPRLLDLGFFKDSKAEGKGDRVIRASILSPLAGLRPASSDKRSQGHLLLLGGTGGYPGAILMAALSALRSGVGLLTVFVPQSLVAAFASRAPEAIWVGLPETPGGGLAPGGLLRIMSVIGRASALAIGPGLGRDPETLALAMDLVKASTVPLVIDADALQPDIVRAGTMPRILTPHAGEYARISGGKDLVAFAGEVAGVVVEKGPVTRISDGTGVYHSFFGGPVLSRGGSGDLLTGLVGGLLAQTPGDPLTAACRGVVWHGLAADHLARAHGQAAVHLSQWIDFLSPALRGTACPPS